MSRPSRPSFLTTASERKKAPAINTDYLEWHYRDILRGLYKWEGLPDDMPEGFVDADILWFNEGFGLKKVKGMGVCGFAARPQTQDIYGRPVTWVAQPYGWAYDGKEAAPDGTDIFTISDVPVLWIQASIRDRCLPYLQVMARAISTLGTNITALSHPVLIAGRASGKAGDNVTAILLKNQMLEGETVIPMIDPDMVGMEALDLKAADNTQNLASIIDWCDARVLEIIGASTGVEKSSGINAQETASGAGGLALSTDAMLALRQNWCDEINKKLGTHVSVQKHEIIGRMIDNVGDAESSDSESEGSEGDSDTSTGQDGRGR